MALRHERSRGRQRPRAPHRRRRRSRLSRRHADDVVGLLRGAAPALRRGDENRSCSNDAFRRISCAIWLTALRGTTRRWARLQPWGGERIGWRWRWRWRSRRRRSGPRGTTDASERPPWHRSILLGPGGVLKGAVWRSTPGGRGGLRNQLRARGLDQRPACATAATRSRRMRRQACHRAVSAGGLPHDLP